MNEPTRLNKALASAGICSRRKADELIFDGKVEINGEIVKEPGRRIDPASDKVLVNGKPIDFAAQSESIYAIQHKPIEVVSTAKDPQGRKTVIDILPEEFKQHRLVPVGRLDFFSEGLLLLTNDGDLTYRLTHPKHHITKVYEAFVRGAVTDDILTAMRKGMTLEEGERLSGIGAEVLKRVHGDRTLLKLTLRQGVNRQIRRMCRDLDLTVLKLKRTAVGPLRLGKLAKGQTRALTPEEINALKKAVGL